MRTLYRWFKITFWVPIALAAAVIGWALSQPRGAIAEPYHAIGDYVMWLSMALGLLHLILLSVLAQKVGKSFILWVLGYVFFPPLGPIIGFTRMCGLVKDKLRAEQTQPSLQADRPGKAGPSA